MLIFDMAGGNIANDLQGSDLARRRDGRQPVRQKDDDLRPLNVLLRSPAIAANCVRSQRRANLDNLSDAARIAYFSLVVNRMIAP